MFGVSILFFLLKNHFKHNVIYFLLIFSCFFMAFLNFNLVIKNKQLKFKKIEHGKLFHFF